MLTPNKERIKLWVKALRSGKYKQGHNFLQCESGHCCLGVACEVAIQNGLEISVIKKNDPSNSPNDFYIQYNGTGDVLPTVVAEWFGLHERPFVYKNKQDAQRSIDIPLDALNDDEMLSFKQIAYIIETNFIKETYKDMS